MTDSRTVGNLPLLKDRFHRRINYLRVSVTDRCNLRCSYCVGHTPSPKLSHDQILRYEEILKLIRIGARHGITKVRVTGGEPLARKGIYSFLKDLSTIPGIEDLSLTTNGLLLGENIGRIKAAGLSRLNISLDSLQRTKFKKITGYDHFERCWDSIMAAVEAGFAPIKINVVALPGLNDGEIVDFARLTLRYPLHVRFIEYMPIGTPELSIAAPLLTPDIKTIVETAGKLVPVPADKNDGPARRFKLENALGEVGFISPVSKHFCSSCNRMRLTASGKLRACLLSDVAMDIAAPLRNGCSDDELFRVFQDAVRNKNEKHHIDDEATASTLVADPMFSIGG